MSKPALARPVNITRATTVGAAAGGSASALIVWGATVAEAKYGVPAPVAAGILGSVFAFLGRWAAKLNPHE